MTEERIREKDGITEAPEFREVNAQYLGYVLEMEIPRFQRKLDNGYWHGDAKRAAERELEAMKEERERLRGMKGVTLLIPFTAE